MHTRKILGTNVNLGLKMNDVLDKMEAFLADGRAHYISTTNPEFIVDAMKDRDFQEIINTADLSLPDGAGVLYAASYLDRVKGAKKSISKALFCGLRLGLFEGDSLGERITGVDLVHKICALSSKKGYTIFLLGGWPTDFWGRPRESSEDLAQKAADCLREKYPGVNIVGATSQFKHIPKDDKATLAAIKKCMREKNLSYVDFLFVAYGHKNQERWIVRNASKVPAKVSIGVGGAFDYVAGVKKYAPSKIREWHLEWLYRLVTQPWRLKRIFVAFPLFPLLVFMCAMRKLDE